MARETRVPLTAPLQCHHNHHGSPFSMSTLYMGCYKCMVGVGGVAIQPYTVQYSLLTHCNDDYNYCP